MRKIRLLLPFCLIFILSGCWDRTEINDVAFVVASGVDKGEKKKYRFSVQIPLTSSMGGSGSSGGGGGTSGEGPFFVAQETGGNIREAMEDIQTRLSRKLYFAHRRVVIIGEELAREGIRETLNSVFIQPQSRLSTYLVISRGEAVKMLEAQPRMEQFSGEAIREMAKMNINVTVKDAIQVLERSGKSAVIPLIETTGTMKKEKNGKEVLMGSFAVFKGDQLSFTSNRSETQGILWLSERMKRKSYTFHISKNQEMTVQIIENTVNPDFVPVDGKPAFDLSVRVTGALLENEPNLRVEDSDIYHLIIEALESEIKKDIQGIMEHSHSLGVDINGFGWYLYKNHNQKWQQDWKKNWSTLLPGLKVNIKVNADIQRLTNSGDAGKE